MSTEFSSRATGQVTALRFAGSVGDTRCSCLEVANPDNLLAVLETLRAGDVLEGLGDSTEFRLADFEALLDQDRVTMGRMPFTVELGSGDTDRLASL